MSRFNTLTPTVNVRFLNLSWPHTCKSAGMDILLDPRMAPALELTLSLALEFAWFKEVVVASKPRKVWSQAVWLHVDGCFHMTGRPRVMFGQVSQKGVELLKQQLPRTP